MNYLIVAGVALLVVGYVCFLVFQALHKGVSSASKALADQKHALADRRAERLAEEQLERGRAYRARNPVRAVGIPNPDVYRRAFTLLDEYASAANAYRPTLPVAADTRFRAYRFPAHMFELARPHPASLSNTDPRKISLTPADVLMGGGADLSSIYGRAATTCEFPCDAPTFRYSPTEVPALKPDFPSVAAPPKAAVRLVTSDGLDVDDRDELQATAYEAELHRVTALNSQARQLHDDL